MGRTTREQQVSTTEKGAIEITGEVEEILRDAWHTARENLLMPSSTEIFAFVRNYSDETELLTDEQLTEFRYEIVNQARCSRCLSRQDLHGCPERCDS
jgi:hypothetical protein